MKIIAEKFGRSLDHDDFDLTYSLLHPQCRYTIGETIIEGPEAICNSYEGNMVEGRIKFDELQWGNSRIEAIDDHQFYVHFTDHLTHQGQYFKHQCKQKLTINNDQLITHIEHINNPSEHARLKAFYKVVGLAKD